MNISKKWINLQDISTWNNSSFDTMYTDLHGMQIAFLNANIPLDDRVYLLSRSESFNPSLLVQQESSGKLFVVVVGSKPYAISLLQENDEHLVLDGELALEDISWIPHMKILAFYKHYIVHNEYQKVIVGYESESEHWMKEETVSSEKYMFETHRRFIFQETQAFFVPKDWYTKPNRTTVYDGIIAPSEPHLACVLLLDTSSSMDGNAIVELNKAVCDFKEQTSMDELAQKRVDVAIIEFNDTARVVQDFTPLTQLQPVNLSATGCTAMGAGINLAIDKVKERNRFYNDLGIPSYKPQIIMISIGAPTDDISLAMQRISEEENKGTRGNLKFWALGVSGYNAKVLESLTQRSYALNEGNFIGFFNWFDEQGDVPVCYESPIDLPPLPSDAMVIPLDW